MRTLLLLLLLLPVICAAQHSSRIVFFRVDRWGESGDIFQNGIKIAESPLHLLYVYTTDTPNGKYFWGIKNNKLDWGADLSITADTNSITFIELKFVTEGMGQHMLSPGNIRYNAMTPVSFDVFKQYCENQKGLRKRLKKVGYNSPDELIKGFHFPGSGL